MSYSFGRVYSSANLSLSLTKTSDLFRLPHFNWSSLLPLFFWSSLTFPSPSLANHVSTPCKYFSILSYSLTAVASTVSLLIGTSVLVFRQFLLILSRMFASSGSVNRSFLMILRLTLESLFTSKLSLSVGCLSRHIL